MSDEKYFAADTGDKAVAHIQRKADSWYKNFKSDNYLDLIRRSWYAYHGKYYELDHSISFGGESGELVNLPVNHYRNIAQHMLTMTTATRPSFQPRSINTDYESQVQTTLAHGLLDYYMREKRLEVYLKNAVEYAIVFGSGFIKMEWDSTSGKIYDYIEPDESEDSEEESEREPFPVYEGDVKFTNLSPFDVVFDSTKETVEQNDWVVCRTFVNRFDLAKKYPEMREKILSVPTKENLFNAKVYASPQDETDDIALYEFFHKRTDAVPEGRYMMYLDADIVLMDTVMPYRDLPIYRIAPANMLGTPYGYSPMFDLLPMQDAVNSSYSTIATNQNAFGVQNILNPRGNDVRLNQVGSGMNFIEYDSDVGKPEALQLTATAPETFNFLNMMISSMETISGVNSVVRGNPESSLKSGNALALVQSQAIQFINGLQQSYILLIEGVGTGLINLLKDFAKVPRIAEISGVSNRTKIKEFTGENLSSVNRVVVDVGNFLAQTTAGRTQMADNLIQMGLIKTPEEYFSVINTGKLEVLTEGQTNQNLLIRAENERLMDGDSDVMATAVDAHSQHIREHLNVLADPDLRLNTELSARVLAHIQEHIDLLRTTDPNLLALIGEQPLPPVGGNPVGMQQPPVPAQGDMAGMDQMVNQSMEAAQQQMGNSGVQPAQPATVEGQPNTPEQQFLTNT